jgi:hypothetical protein
MPGYQSDLGVSQQEAGFGFDGNFFTVSSTLGLTAKASGTQANATPLPSMINQVTTVANIGDAVRLPAARASLVGVEVLAINDAANAMTVFSGDNTDTINGGVPTVGVSQMGGSAVYYVLKSYNPTTGVGAWVANGIVAGYAGGFPTFSTQTGVVASSTQTQAAGTPITAAQVQIGTCAVSGKACTWPPAQPGMEITIINNGAQPSNIFPASQTQGGVSGGDRIGVAAQNAAFSLVVTTPTIFYCFVAGTWITK